MNVQLQLAHDRRNLANELHAAARRMYERGRSDRVLGLAPSLKYGENLYYRAAYRTEASKEVEAVAA